MSEQLAASLFEESTSMYTQGKYPICLALLNDCILLQPSLSILYSNRAISNFSLKQVESALLDLHRSIEINHLNYIAYFNLFSINFLSEKDQDAFENLCFSLSSIYVALYQHAKNHDWVSQSLHYSYNNKQSIFLKAMDSLQKNNHQQALKLLNEAQSLERIEENRNGIHQIINFVENLKGLESSPFIPQAEKSISPFKLMTNIQFPGQSRFEETIQEMLKQFNNLNKLIHQYQEQRIREMNIYTDKSIQNSQKMEKQTNCKTIYDSSLRRSDECIRDQKFGEDQSAFSREDRVDKLHLYSAISEGQNEEDAQIRMKVSSYDLYPLSHDKQQICLYFQQAIFYGISSNGQKFQNVYGVFHYSSDDEQKIIRTANTKLKESLCRWSEWSQAIKLSANPSSIRFTLFNKCFTTFEDQMIGKGQFLLNELGYSNITFTNSLNVQAGKMELIVERAN